MLDPTQLRPLSVGEVLDTAFRLYRANLRTFLKRATAAFLPIGVMLTAFHISSGMPVDWTKVLPLHPDAQQALMNSIHLRLDTGDLEGALQELEDILRLKPHNDWALYNTACIYARWGRAEAALDRLAQAIGLDARWRPAAQADPDFDGLRADPRFAALLASDGDPAQKTAPRTDGTIL